MKTTVLLQSAPQIDTLLQTIVSRSKRFIAEIFNQMNSDSLVKGFSRSSFSSRMDMQQFKRNMKKNGIVILPIVIVFVVILVLIGNFFMKDSRNGSVQGAQDTKSNVAKPLAVEELDKTYTFTLADANGKATKVKFQVQNAELRDQIVLRGQPYSAVQGRVFLIVNLKIVNDSMTNLGMMTKDYLRLTVDGSADKLAPEIHNDPVQVQAISTKLTRVGFAIDDTAKKLVLQVGEINGKKDTVEVHLLN